MTKKTTEERLCDSLMETHEQLKCGEIDVKTAAELSNSAGKIIKAKLGKLDYEREKIKQKGQLARIPFFENADK